MKAFIENKTASCIKKEYTTNLFSVILYVRYFAAKQ